MKKGFWIVVAVLAASIAMNVWFWTSEPEIETILKRDTVWRDTTIYKPQPAETINTGKTVYIKVPMPYPVPSGRDTIHDSIEVPVPIVQKRYEDSLYTAWVSGFQPALDSIRLYQTTIFETITKTIVKPAPRLSVGVQVGAGGGIFTRQPDVYFGIGAQWRLWPK